MLREVVLALSNRPSVLGMWHYILRSSFTLEVTV